MSINGYKPIALTRKYGKNGYRWTNLPMNTGYGPCHDGYGSEFPVRNPAMEFPLWNRKAVLRSHLRANRPGKAGRGGNPRPGGTWQAAPAGAEADGEIRGAIRVASKGGIPGLPSTLGERTVILPRGFPARGNFSGFPMNFSAVRCDEKPHTHKIKW